MEPVFDEGDMIKATGIFAVDDVPTSPGTVQFKIKDPSNNTTTFTLSDAEVVQMEDEESDPIPGAYQFFYTLDEPGLWHLRVQGVNTAEAAAEKSFLVRETAF